MGDKNLSAERFSFTEKMLSKGIREQFLGFDNKTNLPVVIEKLHDSLLEDPQSRAAITAEISALTLLKSPYFVDYIGTFEKQNKQYFVFNFADGQPLSNADSLKILSTRDICSFISKAIRAVAFAHSKGIIHGALSSDSILITPANEPIIIGFNAQWVEPITDPGIINGISQYACAAPELFQGEPIDESCDFYAIGKIAEFMFETTKHNQPQIHASQYIEMTRAKEIISLLCSTQRQHRFSAAQLLIDPDFLGSMRTPVQGNVRLDLSKRELRKIAKRLRTNKTNLRKPISEKTKFYTTFAIKFFAILLLGITILFIILKLG